MTGILLNMGAIALGGTLGSCFRNALKNLSGLLQVSGVAIMLMSAVSLLPDLLTIQGGALAAENMLPTIICLIVGTLLGEWLRIDERLERSAQCGETDTRSAFVCATILFGVGGLQILGPISSVLRHDSGLLISKCLVDFPLAVAFGAALGRGVPLSAAAVGLMQAAIGALALVAQGFFTDAVIAQLGAMGYIILFFVGFNLVFQNVTRVRTGNMLPAIALVILYQAARQIWMGA